MPREGDQIWSAILKGSFRFSVITASLRSYALYPAQQQHKYPVTLSIMPYVDLIHSEDCASIWYETNTGLGNVNSFDQNKPTIVMLHPMFLSSSWFRYQMDDFRLMSTFNMIAFDTRTSGKSISKSSGLYDTSVQAADLAYCLQVRAPCLASVTGHQTPFSTFTSQLCMCLLLKRCP